MQKSEAYLRKAVELAPLNLMNHRYLAETLIELNRIDEARQVLAKVLQLPDDPDWKPESELEKKLAKGLLEEIR